MVDRGVKGVLGASWYKIGQFEGNIGDASHVFLRGKAKGKSIHLLSLLP